MFKTVTVDSVQADSSKAIGVFTKVIQDLKATNEKALALHQEKEEAARNLTAEAKVLRGVMSGNTNFIEKVTNLIS
jgi:hypothetical protein